MPAQSSPRKWPGQKQAPARCTICSDRPLRKVCPHGCTKKTTTERVVENESGQFFLILGYRPKLTERIRYYNQATVN